MKKNPTLEGNIEKTEKDSLPSLRTRPKPFMTFSFVIFIALSETRDGL
jgi:hypothetical protein